jgi:hypothetical protein
MDLGNIPGIYPGPTRSYFVCLRAARYELRYHFFGAWAIEPSWGRFGTPIITSNLAQIH